MQIITLNVNGVRAAARKGFFQWLPAQAADIVCIQELKAQRSDLDQEMIAPAGFHGYFHCAQKKGYSGVGIYCRDKPDNVVEGIGIEEIDQEGRFLRADFGDLSVISLYLPSGSSGDHRQASKFFFMEHFFPILQELIAQGRHILLCGDWNIAHREIDLKNWRLVDTCFR
jgi:exodeoxyribonuclease-3